MRAPRVTKVLILEDQALIMMDIEATLLAHGFEIAAMLSSCEAALEWLKAGTADVVVLDIELRDGVCIDVAKMLVKHKIPFVVHSSSLPNSSDLDPVFQRGGWVRKPFLEAELIATIGEAVAFKD